MTLEEAKLIVKNLMKYLKTADIIAEKPLHKDVYTALEIIIEKASDK